MVLLSQVEQEGFDHNGAIEVEYEENGAASPRLFRDHPKTYDGRKHYAGRRHERAQTRPFAGHYFVKDYLRATAAKSGRPYSAQIQPPQPHPAQPYHAKLQSAKAYPARPYHENRHPSNPSSSHTARPIYLDRAQIHRSIEASPAPYQVQVFSMTRAEPPAPSEPTFDIVYIPRKRANRRGSGRSYIAFSLFVCLCCSPVLGIIAIYLSYQAKTLFLNGNHRKAKSCSIAALIVNIIGVVLGIVLTVVLVLKIT